MFTQDNTVGYTDKQLARMNRSFDRLSKNGIDASNASDMVSDATQDPPKASCRNSGCTFTPVVLSIFVGDTLIDEVYSVESAHAFIKAWDEGRGMREALRLADAVHVEAVTNYIDSD